jgi:hypothetical protein
MALILEERKEVVVIKTLKSMGVTNFAAVQFCRDFSRPGYKTAVLSGMIREAIYHEIEIYRKQTYKTFGMGISISASGPKDPVSKIPVKLTLPLLGKVVVGYSHYQFAPQHNDKREKTMRVRLHVNGVQVYFCGSWRPVSAYLDEIGTETSEPFNAEVALDRQREWWEANGKTFDIQNLPVELAEIVFDHALPVVAQPHPMHKCRKLHRLVVAPKDSMALMHVNKRTHDIAERVLYHTKTFFIKHYPILNKTLNSKNLEQNIRNLTLAFSHSGYLHLFNFDQENVTLPHTYTNLHFRNLNLKSLEVHISAPSKLAETPILEGACQIAAVDLIFSVAWPSIKGHPLTISGWVKESQKKRIESLADEGIVAYKKWASLKLTATNEVSTLSQYDYFKARMMEEEQGGVRLDSKSWEDSEGQPETGLSALTTHGLEHYLECRCETECSAEDWTCKG